MLQITLVLKIQQPAAENAEHPLGGGSLTRCVIDVVLKQGEQVLIETPGLVYLLILACLASTQYTLQNRRDQSGCKVFSHEERRWDRLNTMMCPLF